MLWSSLPREDGELLFGRRRGPPGQAADHFVLGCVDVLYSSTRMYWKPAANDLGPSSPLPDREALFLLVGFVLDINASKSNSGAGRLRATGQRIPRSRRASLW